MANEPPASRNVAPIQVFADVCCPFTHVGLRRLVERREQLGGSQRIHVRAWPLELVNGEPLDAGLIAEEVDALRAQVAPDLFTGFDPAAFPHSSLPALALTHAAYAVHAEAGERVALALRWALFEEGRNIAAPDVLLDVAVSAGIGLPEPCEQDRVREDWAEGQRRGVIGSPHLFIGSSDYFCPSLRIDHVDGHLRITDNRDAFDSFLADTLA
jgi:predicted DsbA family dithiol-disulfide isomerase